MRTTFPSPLPRLRRMLPTLLRLLLVTTITLPVSALSKWHVEAYKGGSTVLSSLSGSTIKAQRSIPGATITVYLTGTSTLATLYSDTSLTPKSNPFTADSSGYGSFFATDGCYDISISGSGVSRTFTYVCQSSSASVSDLFWVTDYGAVGTDTTADDTAFTNAIAAAGTKTVYVPAGTYILDAAKTLSGNLRCASPALTTIKVKDSSSFTNADNNYLFTSASGSVIESCTLDGNKANNSQKRITGVAVTGSVSNVTIRNMILQNFPAYHVPASGVTGAVYAGDGIYVSTTGTNVRIESVTTTNNERAGVVVVQGKDLQVSNFIGKGNGVFCIDIEPDNDSNKVQRVAITNFTCIDGNSAAFSAYGGGLYVVGRQTGNNYVEDVTISNGTIENNDADGLRIEGTDGIHVTNVRSFNNSKQGAGTTPNLRLGDYNRAITISNSAFAQSGVDNPSYSIDVTSSANVNDIFLSNVYYSTINDPGSEIGFKLATVALSKILTATATYDPPSIAGGASAATDITVTGAAIGNPCVGSLTTINTTITVSCAVVSTNTARLTLANVSGAAIDFSSGTARVYVLQP